MKILGIRHVGVHVDYEDMQKRIEWYKKQGARFLVTNTFDDGHDGKPCVTTKLLFNDNSILELTTDYTHVAFNISGKGFKTIWNTWRGKSHINMELVTDG